jgi:hypothetical protein
MRKDALPKSLNVGNFTKKSLNVGMSGENTISVCSLGV